MNSIEVSMDGPGLCPRSNKENVAESTIIKHVDHPWLSHKLVCSVLSLEMQEQRTEHTSLCESHGWSTCLIIVDSATFSWSNKENVAESTIIKHVDHPWLSHKLVCSVLCSCILLLQDLFSLSKTLCLDDAYRRDQEAFRNAGTKNRGPRSNKENVAESTIIKHVDHPWLSHKLVCSVLCSQPHSLCLTLDREPR
jgi:uncharacterized membrane protein